MQIQKNDFVELNYTGKLKDGDIIFDTTEESVANANQLGSKNAQYSPVIVCVGQKQVVPGLDKFLEGKDRGKFTVELAPEEAFGKKDVKLISMVATNKFLQQKIRPVPGLQVNIDGIMGIIRSVNGGRTIVDFNHPLSGRRVLYDVTINRVVTDKKEKVEALARLAFGKNVPVAVEKDTAIIEFEQDLPKPVADEFEKKFKELTGVTVVFEKSADKKKTPDTLQQ